MFASTRYAIILPPQDIRRHKAQSGENMFLGPCAVLATVEGEEDTIYDLAGTKGPVDSEVQRWADHELAP